MKSPFVPLTATSLPKVQKAFVPKVLPTPDPSVAVPPSSDTPPSAHTTDRTHPRGEASVELKKEGDRVIGISVKCACGEVIEIECVS